MGADSGGLVVAGDAEADEAPLLSSGPLPFAKGRMPGHGERRLEKIGVVARVVDHRRAIAVRNASPIGHLFGPNEISSAHVGGIEPELPGRDVEDALGDEGRLSPSGAGVNLTRSAGSSTVRSTAIGSPARNDTLLVRVIVV